MIRSGLILIGAKGKNTYAICREIGVLKSAARKYMSQPAVPHGFKGVRKGSKLDAYKPLLNEKMGQGIYNCVVLLEQLRGV